MDYAVFPASAGVILRNVCIVRLNTSFPRIRGGDPMFLNNDVFKERFSPHPRG